MSEQPEQPDQNLARSQQPPETPPPNPLTGAPPPQRVNVPIPGSEGLTQFIFDRISRVDIEAARLRVADLRTQMPNATPDELTDLLIRRKSTQTAMVGGVTSASGMVPGLGTLAATTIGIAADIGITFTLQSELVLEIAELYNHQLSDIERRQIVLLVTGISAGANQLIGRAGVQVSEKVGAAVAGRWFAKAIPILGIAASAGINAVSTYIVGKRAHAYFKLGPQAMNDWRAGARALTGVDERKIGAAISDAGQRTGKAIGNVRDQLGERTSGVVQQIQKRFQKRKDE